MFGFFNINKPAGWTSRDVVNRVHRLVRPAKAGHAGTLDPLATGVLIVCVGSATRLIQYAHLLPKCYRATFLLGKRSDSDDVESEVEELSNAPIPSLAEIEAVLPKFVGHIEQVPPAYSAISVGGQRAYKLARKGKAVDLEPRCVTVHALRLTRYEYPKLELDIECGSGTYVRALGRDIANQMGTAAVMSALHREWIGNICTGDSVDLEQLESRFDSSLGAPNMLVDALTKVQVTPEEQGKLLSGLTIPHGDRALQPGAWTEEQSSNDIVGIDSQGRVVSILRLDPFGILHPVRNFPPSA